MYRFSPGLVFGFHGCDRAVRDAVINGKEMLIHSSNKYDWLGSGIYFWENDFDRALDFAQNHPARRIKSPSVLGAVIDPGYCLNLLNMRDRTLVKKSRGAFKDNGDIMSDLRNENGLHTLDCLVIENLHRKRQSLRQPPFESVRNAFTEGRELYPGAGFQDKNHIQLCIRNPNCIKAFFIPRLEIDWPPINKLS